MNQHRINEIADELRTAIAKNNDAPRMIREALMPLMMEDPLKEIIASLSDIAEDMDAEGYSTDELLREIRALRNLTV